MGTLYQVNSTTGMLTVANKIALTPEGGIAVLLDNNTGSIIPKGTVCEVGTSDESVRPIDVDDVYPIGVAYEAIPIGAKGWIVFNGRAQVLVDAAAVPVRNNWLGTSGTTAGRARVEVGDPGATVLHSREIGHTLGAKDGGNLVWAMIHFN